MNEERKEYDLVKLVSMMMGSGPVVAKIKRESYEDELMYSMALRDGIAYLFSKEYEKFEA
tara:strand:+ start:429 stop:608 length:180 start_codon:yes stop_codon:yes gene_type:complete